MHELVEYGDAHKGDLSTPVNNMNSNQQSSPRTDCVDFLEYRDSCWGYGKLCWFRKIHPLSSPFTDGSMQVMIISSNPVPAPVPSVSTAQLIRQHQHLRQSCSTNLNTCSVDIDGSGGDETEERDNERTCNFSIMWKSSHRFCRAGPTVTKTMSSTGGPMMMIEGDPLKMVPYKIFFSSYLFNPCAWLTLVYSLKLSMREKRLKDYRLIVSMRGATWLLPKWQQ